VLSREAAFQDDLKRILENVSSKYRFDGIEISRVERDYPIGRKKADIIAFRQKVIPFLIIETKRKFERTGYWRVRRNFRPLDASVVGQAISYAALYKDLNGYVVPFFATANPNAIAFLEPPRILRLMSI